ncbi:transcription elongation factor [Arthrobacter sp. MP_2.3]
MTMTKYARDEFDRVPESSARQGVHRAVAEIRRRRSLGPVLAAGAAALAVGVLAFLALPHPGFSSAGQTPAASGSSSVASPALTAAGGSSASQAASGTPSAPAPTSSAPSNDAPSNDAPVDKTQPVAVFNGSGTAGLATRVGATVSTDGWTLGTLGNWGGAPQRASVIFYSGAGQKGNAEALGQLLGIPSVVDSAEFEVPLVVVLAPGFR